MALKIMTYWHTLITLAKAVGEAKISGNKEEITKAEANLKAYEEIVKKSDGMILPVRRGEL